MDIFAQASSDSTSLALIAIVGTVITALFKLLNDNTKALDRVATASDKVAAATSKSAQEAKNRNGHLGDQNIKLAELVNRQNKDVAEIKKSNALIATTLSKSALIAEEDRDVLLGGAQTVIEQQVVHQTIGHQDKAPDKEQ